MSKNMTDLREAMFDALALLKKGEITVEQAKAASEIGKVLIDSAKVEVDYIRATEGGASDFIEPNGSGAHPGYLGVTRHKLAG